MTVTPNYDTVEYEYATIQLRITLDDPLEVEVADAWPHARCSACDTPIFLADLDDVSDAVDAHQKKHHPVGYSE